MEKSVCISSDVFSAMRSDFDTMLTNTLYNMEQKSTDTATINLKLAIELDRVADPQTGERVLCPKFAHEVSSVMQIKDKLNGMVEGEYKLERKDDGYSISLFDYQTDLLEDKEDISEAYGLPDGSIYR